jgi:hypothetical protein
MAARSRYAKGRGPRNQLSLLSKMWIEHDACLYVDGLFYLGIGVTLLVARRYGCLLAVATTC